MPKLEITTQDGEPIATIKYTAKEWDHIVTLAVQDFVKNAIASYLKEQDAR